ncbi:MAG: hypothetical protein DRI40_02730 [Chloroflexi bacterium]|nr:MAG: hypothetical protein DRI40_02730 [Chloroflexota bacterium]
MEIRDQTSILESRSDLLEHREADVELLDPGAKRLESGGWPNVLFELAAAACYLIDPEGNFVDGNKAAEALIGYRKEELVGSKLFDMPFLAPEQIPKAAGLLARNGERQPSGPNELVLNRKDGSQVSVELHTYPVTIDGRDLILSVVRDITKRKQAEQALQESEQRYRLLAENVTDVIFTTDISLSITYVSPSVERLLGYTVDEASELTLRELLTPESYAIAVKEFGATLDAEGEGLRDRFRPRTRELEFNHKNGSTVWVEVTVSFLRGTNGGPAEILGVARDITDRKRTEQALRESEENFRALAENAVDGILIGMDEGGHVYANKRAAELSGCTVPELRRAKIEDLVHPDEVEKLLERQRKKQEGKRVPRRFETVVLRKDGTRLPVEMVEAKTVWQGKLANMMILRDISERKRAEDELRVKDSAIASSVSAIVISDLQGTVMYVNPAFLKMWRYQSEEDIVGKNVGEFPEMADLISEITEAVYREGSWQGEFLGERPTDGSKYAVHLSVSKVTDEAGKPIRLMATFVDMTERKEMERKLQELYVQERQLREDLEREIHKRVEFTRTLVHELKTPLTAMMASIELLVCESPQGALLTLAKNLDRGASNLNKRIDELLDLARGELGMLRLNCKEVDLLQLLRRVADDETSAALSHGQKLVTQLPTVLPEVWADEERVQQVVLNLLSNALKFTPEGGTITLKAYEGENSVVVEVRDTGAGIDEEDQRRLFQPYHRLESDRERLSGLGLGLSLCKTLVELHGGQIWLRSEKGKGSTFGFWLPTRPVEMNTTTQGEEEADDESGDD